MPDRMPEAMPDRIPDRMPEYMSDRMSEYIQDLSKYTSRHVMVGITRSKVIFAICSITITGGLLGGFRGLSNVKDDVSANSTTVIDSCGNHR